MELLTDFNLLLMVEKGIRGGMCHAPHRYAKVNEQQLHGRLSHTKKNPHISCIGYQQFVYTGDVTNVAFGWFQMEKRHF